MTAGAEADRGGQPSFIQVYLDVFTAAECRAIVTRFEDDPRVKPSWGKYSAQPKNRTGSMIALGAWPEWADVVEDFHARIRSRIDHYAETFLAFKRIWMTGDCELSAPLLERIGPGQGFDWHFDGNLPGTERRVLATIVYLADVDHGGQTQFAYQGIALAPKAGSLVLFPPFWTHLHRGDTPTAGYKYNLTNFVVLKSAPR
ncbi:MAG: 2OG-Fe(II) oxygenase [Alphaproteobacteria bacterium]|nr:2OG-Fe(II) oxygenase [Alphaproteobacteria bacterium]